MKIAGRCELLVQMEARNKVLSLPPPSSSASGSSNTQLEEAEMPVSQSIPAWGMQCCWWPGARQGQEAGAARQPAHLGSRTRRLSCGLGCCSLLRCCLWPRGPVQIRKVQINPSGTRTNKTQPFLYMAELIPALLHAILFIYSEV